MSLPDLLITPIHQASARNAKGATTHTAILPAEVTPVDKDGKPIPGAADVAAYYLTEYLEAFSPRYNLTNTFGRMDPIVNYQGTGRKITLGVKVVVPTLSTTFHTSMKKIMYPSYDATKEIPNALLIERPPLVLVSYGAQITDNADSNAALLCVLEQYAATPKAGFTPIDSPLVRFGTDASNNNAAQLDFQEYSFRFDFIPLHSVTPGFNNSAVPAWIGGNSF